MSHDPHTAGDRLTGKVAIVTGATSGIGTTIARRLTAEGAHVLACGRSEQRGADIAAQLGGPAHYLSVNLTETDAPQQIVDTCVERFGGLDVLVNNAGMDYNHDLVDAPLEDIRMVFDLNVLAATAMLQVAARQMLTGGGSIINITSRLASIGIPKMSIYSATKGAMLSLTRAAAVELAPHNIRVNAVAPGMTRTPLYDRWLAEQPDPAGSEAEVISRIPLGQVALPEDVAAAVAYLAADDSAYVTGASIPLDGGYTAQ